MGHVVRDDGTTVRFSTTSPNEGDPAYHLTLSHLWYSADFELSMSTPLRSGRHDVDGVWHTDVADCSNRLRRHPGGGDATLYAEVTLIARVLPKVASWLYSPEGRALLNEGSTYRRTGRVAEAVAAEQVLRSALGRVVRTQTLLEAGFRIDDTDQQLLHRVNHDLGPFVHRTDRPPTATRPAASARGPADRPARGPEPPGL